MGAQIGNSVPALFMRAIPWHVLKTILRRSLEGPSKGPSG